MTEFTQALKKRRSIYALGDNLPQSQEEITALVKEVVRESPSSFNSQTQRVVFLFGDAHKKLWSITEEALKPLTPAEAFPNTQAKLQSFAAGYGTLLFFEDMDIVKNLQEQFELYAENFPVWSEQASGLTQANVWTALAQENIGANLQHYNPVIDEAVAKEWSIPSQWKLRAQLVFGSIEAPAGEKEYMEDSARFLEFN
ncbi:nitroreductase [Enterococcus sp. DIV0840]|uniref:Nitroreductase n=1 Tax=Enterococcus ureasiticus TaxID=903984 RepID=A0A1E5GGR5_9ENTE|nr:MULTISPECIES: nitroreductase family protein [Enterococcus]MBO0434583.1 nitroreductase family protein [Enterococcus sp. DIV0849a]MBO0472198.1 nitroreductase family protein [Enterococcus ureasiticus]OEG11916.1 nitroreductase [Enterococcus ureasiticus]